MGLQLPCVYVHGEDPLACGELFPADVFPNLSVK